MTQTIFKPHHSTSLNFILSKTYIWLGISIGLICHPATAQDIVTIDRNIANQPITLSGNTSGNLEVVEVSQTESTPTGYCDGYINPQPNHLLELESFFNYLKLEVESTADTTVLIKGNGGVWCNDDSGSANPIIEGQWQQGQYQVWVGSYQSDISNTYQIKVTGK